MDGILVVNKPAGITSHDVIDIIRKKMNMRRIGHTGTLDPMATGVLIILIGKATKLSKILVQDEKEYVATLFLGRRTDTQDSAGRVLEERSVTKVDIEEIKKVFKNFLGEIEQVPPMVSSKKYNGRKLYELARQGKSVPRESRKVTIREIEILDFNLPEIVFRVRCSKGTYIRTLCEDIGRSLGYPAHMSALVRTRAGRFLLEDACGLDSFNETDIQPI